MSLSQDIRDLLLAILHDEVIPMSWGISEINVGSDRVSFFVYGLIYAGRIEITAVDRHKSIESYLMAVTVAIIS